MLMISSPGLSSSVAAKEPQLELFERFSCRLRCDHRDLRCSDLGAGAWMSWLLWFIWVKILYVYRYIYIYPTYRDRSRFCWTKFWSLLGSSTGTTIRDLLAIRAKFTTFLEGGWFCYIYKKQMQHWSQKKNIVSCPSAYLSQYLWGLSFGHVCCQTCPRIILEKNNFKNGSIDFCVHSRLTPEFLCVLSIT